MKSLLTFLMGILICAGCNAKNDNSLLIDTKKSSFEIKLKANPTTGYQWQVVSYDHSLFNLQSSVYLASKTKLIGAGGEMLFTFALKPNQKYPTSSQMQFKYARPWENEAGTLKTIQLRFK